MNLNSPKKPDLSGLEVKAVFSDLVRLFEGERWGELLDALERVSEVGERGGRREIALQAQSLRTAIESRVRVFDAPPFGEMSDQFDTLVLQLKAQLSHLAWTRDIAV